MSYIINSFLTILLFIVVFKFNLFLKLIWLDLKAEPSFPLAYFFAFDNCLVKYFILLQLGGKT